MKRWGLSLVLLTAILASVAAVQAQAIDPARGVDPTVDYPSLVRFGPWDDRNYKLTAEDLAWLADDEADLEDLIPAFFRVQLRKQLPELRRSGPAQYPLSALPMFNNLYGGYLIDGTLYRQVTFGAGGFEVHLIDGVDQLWYELQQTQLFLNGESRVTSPVGAAESAVNISPVDTDLVIAGTNGPGGGQRMHYSSDGGATWTQTTLPLGGTCCDPTQEWSIDGSVAYASTLCGSICGVWIYRSADNGQTWTDLETDTPGDPRRELGGGSSDKQWLHVDHSPTSPHADNVYVCWHIGNTQQFGRSSDFANTWSTQSFPGEPIGIGCDLTTDTAGNIYYFYESFATRQVLVKKSTDGGVSFASSVVIGSLNATFNFRLLSMESRQVAIIVQADADRSSGPFAGSIYASWSDTASTESGTAANNHGVVRVAYSRDGGATWTVTTPHETADVNEVDRYQQSIRVDDNGVVHVIFYDTRRDPSRQSVDVFYTFSTDGAATFEPPVRVTTEQSPNIPDGFEFGDYSNMDVIMNEVIAIYTDNRDETGGGAPNSKDVYVVGFPSMSGGAGFFTDGFESGDVDAWALSAGSSP